MHVIAAFALTYAWVLAMPMLIRPVFTWRDLPPQVLAIKPLQEWTWILPVVAAAASLTRFALERASLRRTRQDVKAVAPANDVKSSVNAPGARRAVSPSPFGMLIRAVGLTTLMAGLTTSWKEAAILLSVFIVCDVVRVIIAGASSWQRILAHVPLIFRFAAALVASYFVGGAIIRVTLTPGATYLPVIYVMGAGLVITAVLTAPPTQAVGPSRVSPTKDPRSR